MDEQAPSHPTSSEPSIEPSGTEIVHSKNPDSLDSKLNENKLPTIMSEEPTATTEMGGSKSRIIETELPMLTTEDPAGTTEMVVYHHPGELENQATLPTEDPLSQPNEKPESQAASQQVRMKHKTELRLFGRGGFFLNIKYVMMREILLWYQQLHQIRIKIPCLHRI